jgi:hypothetical protein
MEKELFIPEPETMENKRTPITISGSGNNVTIIENQQTIDTIKNFENEITQLMSQEDKKKITFDKLQAFLNK